MSQFARIDVMLKVGKLVLGIATLYPLVYLSYYLLAWQRVVPPPPDVLNLASSIEGVVLFFFYVWRVKRSPLPDEEKTLVLRRLNGFSILALPWYWLNYVWRTPLKESSH